MKNTLVFVSLLVLLFLALPLGMAAEGRTPIWLPGTAINADGRYVVTRNLTGGSGVPIIDVPLFPETLGSGDETVVLLTDPKNINVGIWRRITIETDKDITAGTLVIVATLRFDVKYAEERATAKATNVKIP